MTKTSRSEKKYLLSTYTAVFAIAGVDSVPLTLHAANLADATAMAKLFYRPYGEEGVLNVRYATDRLSTRAEHTAALEAADQARRSLEAHL